jgi:hypothetical protein
MSLRDAYREKMEAQLEEQRARLNLLRAQARRAVADGKIMAYEELAEAEAKLAAATGKLKELAGASEAAFGELKAGMEQAWTSLTRACQKAADKFKGAPPPGP